MRKIVDYMGGFEMNIKKRLKRHVKAGTSLLLAFALAIVAVFSLVGAIDAKAAGTTKVKVLVSDGNRKWTYYDNGLIKSLDFGGLESTFKYDDKGKPISSESELEKRTVHYAKNGNPTSITSERTSSDGSVTKSTLYKFTCNKSGKITAIKIDSKYAKNSTTYTYGKDGKLAKEKEIFSSTTLGTTRTTENSYKYDEKGNILHEEYTLSDFPGNIYVIDYNNKYDGDLMKSRSYEFDYSTWTNNFKYKEISVDNSVLKEVKEQQFAIINDNDNLNVGALLADLHFFEEI